MRDLVEAKVVAEFGEIFEQGDDATVVGLEEGLQAGDRLREPTPPAIASEGRSSLRTRSTTGGFGTAFSAGS